MCFVCQTGQGFGALFFGFFFIHHRHHHHHHRGAAAFWEIFFHSFFVSVFRPGIADITTRTVQILPSYQGGNDLAQRASSPIINQPTNHFPPSPQYQSVSQSVSQLKGKSKRNTPESLAASHQRILLLFLISLDWVFRGSELRIYHSVLGITGCTFVDILTYLPMMSTYT